MKVMTLGTVAVLAIIGWTVYDSTQPADPYVVIYTSTGGDKATGELRHKAICVPERYAGTWGDAEPWPDGVPYKEVELTAEQQDTLQRAEDYPPCPQTTILEHGTT